MEFMDIHYMINGKPSSIFQEINKEAEKARLQAYATVSKYGHELRTKYGLSGWTKTPESNHSAESRDVSRMCCRTGTCTNTLNRNELKQIVIGDKLAYIKVSSEWKKVNFTSIEPEKTLTNCNSPSNALEELLMKVNSKIVNHNQYFRSLNNEQLAHLQSIETQRVRELACVSNDPNFFRDEDLNIDELIESFLDPNFLKKRLQNMLHKEFKDMEEVPISIRDLMWYADNQNAALSNMSHMEENFNQTTSNCPDEDIFCLFDRRTKRIAESIQVASRHLFTTNEHLLSCKAGQIPSSLSFRILIVLFKLIWSKFTMEKVIDLIIIQKLYFYIKSLYHTLDAQARGRIASILKGKNYVGKFLECFGYDFVLYDTTSQDISAINYLRCICHLHGSRSVTSITREIAEDIAVGKYFDNYVSKVNTVRHRRMPYTRSFNVGSSIC